MEAAGLNHRKQRGGGLGVGVAAVKQRVLARDHGRASFALGVHPDLARDGLGSSLGGALTDMLTSLVGEANLSQVTFMFVQGRSSGWSFGGYKLVAGTLTPFDVHGTAAPRQELHGIFGAALEILPASPLAATMLALAESSPGMLLGSPEEVAEALALSYALENPNTTHNPDTVDCVTCHVAGRLRRRALSLGNADVAGDRFTIEGYNLTNTTDGNLVGDPTMVRTFGYLGNLPVLGDRVIHESAAVAQWLATQ